MTKLVHVDIANMTPWKLLHVSKYIKVIKKVVLTLIHSDVSTCTDDPVVVLLRPSFRLSEEVGLMLTFILVFALLVKVNEVFGGAAITGPMPLCSTSIAIALLFPTVVTSFLLGVEPTFGLSLSFDLEHGTPLPLPLSLSTAPLAVARTLSNISITTGILLFPLGEKP
jgi:hypothetical protein